MAITNLRELRACAKTHCPEEYARFPTAGSFEITTVGSCVSVHVGTISRATIHHDLISFESPTLKVQAHLESGQGFPILAAGNFKQLTPSYYDKIDLSEPFCWIWPSLNGSIGLPKFNTLVRYALMVHGHYGGLSDMPFGIQEVFPQLCADLAKGPGIKIAKSTRKGEKYYVEGTTKSSTGKMQKLEPNEKFTENDISKEQQISRDIFENSIQYLSEEFHAFTAVLRADHEAFVELQAQHGAVVKDLKKEVEVADCRVQALEAELEGAQAGEKMWKYEFEKLQNIVRNAIDDLA